MKLKKPVGKMGKEKAIVGRPRNQWPLRPARPSGKGRFGKRPPSISPPQIYVLNGSDHSLHSHSDDSGLGWDSESQFAWSSSEDSLSKAPPPVQKFESTRMKIEEFPSASETEESQPEFKPEFNFYGNELMASTFVHGLRVGVKRQRFDFSPPLPVKSGLKIRNENDSAKRSRSIGKRLPPGTPPTLSSILSPCSRDGRTMLQILGQPEEQHRARYQTEGSRGAIKDRKGNGFPTVKLVGYDKPATLQIFIGTDFGRVSPHMFYQACKVTGKSSTPCVEKKVEGTVLIEIDFEPSKELVISCDCVGILKERNVDVEQRFPFHHASQSRKKSTKCRLIFRTTILNSNGEEETLQAASFPILCTQPPGLPEICKQSIQEVSAKGETELFIIGKNFLKDTKVFVQEEDRDGNVVWEAKAEVLKDYLQQNHLICVLPSYRDENIVGSVEVKLLVSSGGKMSEPQNLTYLPIQRAEVYGKLHSAQTLAAIAQDFAPNFVTNEGFAQQPTQPQGLANEFQQPSQDLVNDFQQSSCQLQQSPIQLQTSACQLQSSPMQQTLTSEAFQQPIQQTLANDVFQSTIQQSTIGNEFQQPIQQQTMTSESFQQQQSLQQQQQLSNESFSSQSIQSMGNDFQSPIQQQNLTVLQPQSQILQPQQVIPSEQLLVSQSPLISPPLAIQPMTLEEVPKSITSSRSEGNLLGRSEWCGVLTEGLASAAELQSLLAPTSTEAKLLDLGLTSFGGPSESFLMPQLGQLPQSLLNSLCEEKLEPAPLGPLPKAIAQMTENELINYINPSCFDAGAF